MRNLWQIVQKINIGPEKIFFNVPMREHTSFGIGGPADLFIEPANLAQLKEAVNRLGSEGIPLFFLGGGANILVGDKGIRGAVISLGGIKAISLDSRGLWADAGVRIDLLCEDCLARGLSGFENFYGMPGSLGGALYMNARCYEKDISELVSEIFAISPEGAMERLILPSNSWSYKSSPFQPGGLYSGWIIVGALLGLKAGEAPEIAATMRARKQDRTAKGQYAWPSAGSMFKNNRRFGQPTGAILDTLGLKGFKIGDAAISPLHANIFVNLGEAKASDMRALIAYAAEKAFSSYNFSLEPEVQFVGEF